ncbi:hypothetical protein H4W32_002797 [Actinophytocola algeriensis]|uniref:Uncharacterized protein n=1 Tax=Actinophytocola algeriensis TaxID=1768010 RepID=A0A7W7Q8D5_9PSEU|nr:hypothetical protein [Actinophytocola algeriensis]MBE1474755.1 hypothetical protein [Actinophytocola algeriensis]
MRRGSSPSHRRRAKAWRSHSDTRRPVHRATHRQRGATVHPVLDARTRRTGIDRGLPLAATGPANLCDPLSARPSPPRSGSYRPSGGRWSPS